MSTHLLDQCQWPVLPEPYITALREAVGFILGRFPVHGIIVSGSIISGNASPSSDLDIMVLHAQPQRQRLQRFFQGVPTEIFVNPPQAIRGYFAEERTDGRPSTAHMWANGFVVLNGDALVDTLRQEAAAWLQKSPDPTPLALTMKRYFNADAFENALDLVDHDPAMALLLMHTAIWQMVNDRFLIANRPIPRHKAILAKLKELDPPAGAAVERFLLEPALPAKWVLGKAAAYLLNGAIGFFEWETEPETITAQ